MHQGCPLRHSSRSTDSPIDQSLRDFAVNILPAPYLVTGTGSVSGVQLLQQRRALKRTASHVVDERGERGLLALRQWHGDIDVNDRHCRFQVAIQQRLAFSSGIALTGDDIATGMPIADRQHAAGIPVWGVAYALVPLDEYRRYML
ncbi:hypothetical protein SODG_000031 [Sodalis praecaptivus]